MCSPPSPPRPHTPCRAITYAFKPDAFPPPPAGQAQQTDGGRQHGFIAQEVEVVAPEVVSEDSRGFKAVAYSRLVPVLVSALSDALDRVDNIERLVATGNATTPAAAVSGRSSGVGVAGARGGTTTQRRRVMAMGALGRQEAEETNVSFDMMQLSVENTGLRGRISELERRMADLEEKLDVLAWAATAMGVAVGADAAADADAAL